jgi:predicted nucleic acid-binding protein
VISATAYAETLIHATATGSTDVVDGFLDDAGVTIVPITRPTARTAATLRARHHSLRLPDALTLATATEHDAELLTFDRRLSRIASAEAT